MLAARFHGPGDIRLEELPRPALPPKGALLKVLACGVCGTDKRIFTHGHFRIPPGTSRILGHEMVGELVEIDRSHRKFKPGDRVVLAPNVGCGTCRVCQAGYTQLCENFDAFGISMDGGFAQYMAIPAVAFEQGNVLHLPGEFSLDEGAMVEISACAYRGLSACRPQPGESVLIIGGGTVTYLLCGWARLLQAGKVLVSVIEDGWGELSQRGNPDAIINSRKENLGTRVLEETDGLGADVVMVACSAKDMDELAPELAAIQGRVNYFGGLPQNDATVCINSRLIHYREVTILGTTGANVAWMEKTLRALRSRPFDLLQAITHRYPLAEIEKAFQAGDHTPRFKTIIYCNDARGSHIE
jgi:L-iditol 2-dehydrogenase